MFGGGIDNISDTNYDFHASGPTKQGALLHYKKGRAVRKAYQVLKPGGQ